MSLINFIYFYTVSFEVTSCVHLALTNPQYGPAYIMYVLLWCKASASTDMNNIFRIVSFSLIWDPDYIQK